METTQQQSPTFDFRPIACPTCGVDDTDFVGRRGGSAHRAGLGLECVVVRCRRCSLLYPNPFPFPTDLDELYGEAADYFSAHEEQTAKTQTREALIADVERFVSGRRLLDVGAGLGETVAAAARRGWDAYGVEQSSRFVEKAEKLVPGRVFNCSLEDASPSLREDPFDAVVLAAVLEHLHEPSKILALAATYLKPGGIIFLDVPNESGLFFRIGNLWNKVQRRDWVVNLAPTFSPYHVFGFNKRSLTAILRKHGFAVEEMTVFAGESVLPLQRTARGVAEWLASNAVHVAARYGQQGTYIKCFARRV
jgi:2-polyprenyl-3-methyl-5-hydroxy-6-metoxy-1,4-benzoquinol methylase